MGNVTTGRMFGLPSMLQTNSNILFKSCRLMNEKRSATFKAILHAAGGATIAQRFRERGGQGRVGGERERESGGGEKEIKGTQKDRGILCWVAWYFIPYKRNGGTMAGTRKNGMKWDRGRRIGRKGERKKEAHSRQCEDSSLCKQCEKREWLKEWRNPQSPSLRSRKRREMDDGGGGGGGGPEREPSIHAFIFLIFRLSWSSTKLSSSCIRRGLCGLARRLRATLMDSGVCYSRVDRSCVILRLRLQLRR